MPLGLPRDRDAVASVAPENLQYFLCLRPAEQFFKAHNIFETHFRGIRALVGVAQNRPTLHPLALLLEVQESLKTGSAPATSRAHSRNLQQEFNAKADISVYAASIVLFRRCHKRKSLRHSELAVIQPRMFFHSLP